MVGATDFFCPFSPFPHPFDGPAFEQSRAHPLAHTLLHLGPTTPFISYFFIIIYFYLYIYIYIYIYRPSPFPRLDYLSFFIRETKPIHFRLKFKTPTRIFYGHFLKLKSMGPFLLRRLPNPVWAPYRPEPAWRVPRG